MILKEEKNLVGKEISKKNFNIFKENIGKNVQVFNKIFFARSFVFEHSKNCFTCSHGP